MDERETPDREPVPRYWFPMKTYGWGWGPPCTWEGWLVTLTYVALLALNPFFFPPERNMTFPDLAPWLDNVSDDYDELPSGDHDVPYDE
jgi:hypothetical protein